MLLASVKIMSARGDDVAQERERVDALSNSQRVAAAAGRVTVSDQAQDAMKRLVADDFSKTVFDEILVAADGGAAPVASVSSGGGAVAEAPVEAAETQTAPEVKAEEEPHSLDKCLAELDALVGLEGVKQQVRAVIATHQVNMEREKLGLKQVTPGNNLVFSGDPGTGKTTVARIVSDIYKSLGVLSKGHLVETGKADLVAEYVGQTAPLVKKAVARALNGTLFIDEAYSLTDERAGSFGAEAIATLIQEMETHRGKLAIIVAGYTQEMEFFIKSNPGLRSRFTTVIEFPSYSNEQLLEIFESMADQHGIGLGKGVREKLQEHFQNNQTHGDAGNGRYVRKLFERMNNLMSERAMADGVIELEEITAFQAADVPDRIDAVDPRKGRVGF